MPDTQTQIGGETARAVAFRLNGSYRLEVSFQKKGGPVFSHTCVPFHSFFSSLEFANRSCKTFFTCLGSCL